MRSPTNRSDGCSIPLLKTGPCACQLERPQRGRGSIASTIPLFAPQLESSGYQDFNVFAFTGNLFVPAPGTYAITFQYKDQIMVEALVQEPRRSTHPERRALSTSPIGSFGQDDLSSSMGYLLYSFQTSDGSGTHKTTTYNFTFSEVRVSMQSK